MAPPPRVAIAFHGEYVRTRPHCSDFFAVQRNIAKYITDDLASHGTQTFTFFHTVQNPWNSSALDVRLRCALRPVAGGAYFASAKGQKIVDSYIAVLRAVVRSVHAVDAVVLLRFDLRFRVPITAWNVSWGKVNFAFPDAYHHPGVSQRKTSDLLFVLPLRFIPVLSRALQRTRATADNPAHSPNGNGHWTYELLGQAIGVGNLSFIDARPALSTLSPADGRFVGLDRSCPSMTALLVLQPAAPPRGCAVR